MNRRFLFLFALLVLSILLFAGSLLWPAPVAFEQSTRPMVHVIRRVMGRQPAPEPVWTETDRKVQRQLQGMLEARVPPHRLVFDRVRTIDGRLVEDHPDRIVFLEEFGGNGEMRLTMSRDRVVRVEDLNGDIPEVTLRDVRFFREFSGLEFYKRPPYTLITDESIFAVDRAVKQQQELYARFVELMGPLTQTEKRRNDIQLLFFSDTDEFEAYRPKNGSVIPTAAGFYNIWQDRLVVNHQRDAAWVKESQREISGVVKKERAKLRTDRQHQQLSQWEKDVRSQLGAQAVVATKNILRHEGTHQLSYTLGVQNPMDDSRGWISEALATYFETARPGGRSEGRSAELAEAVRTGKIIPLRRMLSIPRCESALQYAEAWSLGCFLMQPDYRSGFFAYLDRIRTHPTPAVGGPVKELCGFLSLSEVELERRWMEFIRAKLI